MNPTEHSTLATLKHYFHTEHHELMVFRFFSLLVMFFLPLYGFVLEYLEPSSIEYFSHRCIIALYFFIILILSFKIKTVEKHMALFSYIGLFTTMLWIIWVVNLNHFSSEYTIGFFLTYCSAGIVFKDRIGLGIFTFTIIPFTAFLILNNPNLEVNPIILLLSMLIIGLVYFIIIVARGYINEQLEELNQNLEEKVTERTRLAEQKTIELQEKNQELERFASIASHDLKAPLTTIGNFVSLLDRKTKKLEDEAIQEYSSIIQTGVQRMSQTVDDLLEYSRMGKEGMKPKEVDFNHLVEVVLNGIGSSINRPDVQLELPKQFPDKVICESRQMEQLFQNLIENAIKFNRSKLKKVIISFEEQPDFWTFSIKDNGIGIPEESLKYIFEMFKRLHTMDEFPGTGIGLGTCKRIVDNHQGDIRVESKMGEGTAFIFSISKKLQPFELAMT